MPQNVYNGVKRWEKKLGWGKTKSVLKIICYAKKIALIFYAMLYKMTTILYVFEQNGLLDIVIFATT